MRTLSTFLLLALVTTALSACSNPKKRRAKAEAEYTEMKAETLEDYRKCVDKAKGDEEKLEKCEPLLKALEATTGGKGK
jgi:hypothetical protein